MRVAILRETKEKKVWPSKFCKEVEDFGLNPKDA